MTKTSPMPRRLPRREGGASLRTTMTWTMALVGTLAVLVALALVFITARQHRSTQSLVAALASVQHAEALEVSILLESRAGERVVRASLDAELRRRLDELRAYVSTPEEGQVLERSKRELEAYLALPDGEGGRAKEEALARVFSGLDELVAINVAQAHAAEEEAGHWDRFADRLGWSAAALLVVGLSGALLWLRTVTLQPVLQLRRTMQAFGEGDREARAAEDGPAEFGDIARQFNAMAEALRAHRERQLAFMGGVAHDLRNPLSALSASVALVSPSKPLPSEERVRKTMAVVQRQVGRLQRMVGDLLDAAQLEAGQLQLQLGLHDAREVATDAFELYRTTSSQHALQLTVPEEPLVAWLDATRMAQVLNNLVSNAIKYSPGGGRVSITLRQEGAEAVFAVADEGVGLSAEDQERLFEAFRRVGVGPETASGTGLGLFIAKRIVEAHHGHLTLRSERGKGSTFEVRLPLGETG